MFAIRDDRTEVTMADFDYAWEKIQPKRPTTRTSPGRSPDFGSASLRCSVFLCDRTRLVSIASCGSSPVHRTQLPTRSELLVSPSRYTPVACPRSSAARRCRRLGRWLRARVRRVRRRVAAPQFSKDTYLLGDAIAVVNSIALLAIVAGVYFIRHNEVQKHRAAMLTAFTLIMVFLALYLLNVGGGFEKEIVAEGFVWTAYIVMLAIHILLSAVSVPVVVHAVVLGLTHSPAELRETIHARVGPSPSPPGD